MICAGNTKAGCEMVVTEERADMVARLLGALDAASAPSVRDALLLLLEVPAKAGCLVVDLSTLSLLDAQGATLLAAFSRHAYTTGTRLRLRAPAHHLRAIVAAAATHPFLRA